MVKPINSLERLISEMSEQDHRLRDYEANARRGYLPLNNYVERDLQDQNWMYLNAANATSRIAVARIAERRIEEALARLPPSMPIFWITLAPLKYAMAASEAKNFDVRRLQGWTRQVLGGLSFIGCVDVAYYPRYWGFFPGTKAMSFHVHALAWGMDRHSLFALSEQLNAKYDCMIPGAVAVHVQDVPLRMALQKVPYMLKRPTKSYRIRIGKRELTDSETGEITSERTYKQFKQKLRTREIVMSVNLLHNWFLEELFFGSLEGTTLRNEIVGEVLRPMFRRDPGSRNASRPGSVNRG